MKPVLRRLAVALPALTGTAATAQAPTGDAWTTAAKLRRGVNIIGYDPLWKDPAKARFQPRHFKTIRNGGFDFVRVVLFAFDHMDEADRLDPW